MSCFHPLKMYRLVDPRTGELSGMFSYHGYVNDFMDFLKENPDVQGYVCPCGVCSGCRSDYAKSWADRLALEAVAQGSDRAWFVTLTYDDEHLPVVKTVDRATLKVGMFPNIRMDDVSSWLKRVRSRLHQPGIRFFAAAEYGSLGRSHYHVILFADLPDVRPSRPTDDLEVQSLPKGVFFSPVLQECWSKGYVSVCKADYAAMRYVAGYTAKKLKGAYNEAYKKLVEMVAADSPDVVEQDPEQARMSRRPGIGVPWIEVGDVERAERSGEIYVTGVSGSQRVGLPKLFGRYLNLDKARDQMRDRASARTLLTIRQQPSVAVDSTLSDHENARSRVGFKHVNPRNKVK